MTEITFSEISVETPTEEQVASTYANFESQLSTSADDAQIVAVVRQWDQFLRELATWEALVHLNFNQDTSNSDYQAARDYCDKLRPKLTEFSNDFKNRLLQEPARSAIENEFGSHCLNLWEVIVETYDPSIEAESVRESELEAEYNQLLASAEFEFQGETLNLSGIGKFAEDPNRDTRYESRKLCWNWFGENREQLDNIYDQLVKLRTTMAKKLGFPSYIELAYKKLFRIDYNRDDVDRYRKEVREHVVPLGMEIRKQQAAILGISDGLKAWDEPIYDLQGNPKPQGSYDEQIVAAQSMFDDMGGGLGEFFQIMRDSDLMDLKNRPNKAGGGFCTSFDSIGLPYIFANFNGTKGDVEVFTHEIGHAFQFYLSSKQAALIDYQWPTYESCEIHSMGLEFLTYPFMENFFGDEASRFRKIHLTQALLFLPYGVAVDHFQHLVYAEPDATPERRFEMWREMEQTYMPWRDWGDLAHAADGGRWQGQRHIYLNPFYYIDYTLAQACALQFWLKSREDRGVAMRDYVALCKRGGEASFQTLAKSAGLTSPFEEGCLENVVKEAQLELSV